MSGKLRHYLLILTLLTLSLPGLTQTVDLSNSLNAGKLKIPGDTTWKKIEFGANLNQGSFSSNWTGGGVNSVALGLFFNALSEKIKGKNAWRNDFQSQYGVVRNKGQQSRKNVDRIFFDTKYNRSIGAKWSLFANVNFLSQFGDGYNYSAAPDSTDVKRKVSGIFSPAYVTEAIGIEYRPAPYFFIDFAPGALRQTIVLDKNLYVNTPDQNNYGVPIGKRVRTEAALIQIVANFDKDIVKDLNLKFRYLMFSNFKNPGNIDNRLDAMLTAKINKYVNVNLGAIMVYDDDQSDKVQFAQALSIGFLYSF
ncbi:DUF3078 domain-containing protein [Dyadobacter chenwenxiniae]|uniref:DUF3078 domain-containing protein n=1 Tax=Dyadobacter chenwenxiniae TaxID=2906456 RepID=A0A9X1TNF7_9BACT|nr:DUF3078 domain-containing protein [Dyadobacter chenwenxiniae]MCF0051195.1 DUF3078 domain-containing protein [Dyadobacter chenwenxiniae]MCF0064513.1 DUF3078 domain-containing protein [Dyadobacter chenwenxiniae]UON82284.1 DUF3078 domain-containing protein [Dyadobacter chenwenxiniae]